MPVSVGLRTASSTVLANPAATDAYSINGDVDASDECGLLSFYPHQLEDNIYQGSIPVIAPFHSIPKNVAFDQRLREDHPSSIISGSDDGDSSGNIMSSTRCERRVKTRRGSFSRTLELSRPHHSVKSPSAADNIHLNITQRGTIEKLIDDHNVISSESSLSSVGFVHNQSGGNTLVDTAISQPTVPNYVRLCPQSEDFATMSSKSSLQTNLSVRSEDASFLTQSPAMDLPKQPFCIQQGTNPIDSGPSYATLTPMQPLPSLPNQPGTAMAPLSTSQDIANIVDISYQKMTGMGQSLPPLSNHMLINGINVQHGFPPHVIASAAEVDTSTQSVLGIHYSRPMAQFSGAHNQYDAQVLDHNIDQFTGGQLSVSMLSGRSSGITHNFPYAGDPTVVHARAYKPSCSTGRNIIGKGNGPGESQSEDISTKEVAEQVTNDLKRFSIPQAIFAQQVLNRSQGTLSDLLRNPKPWSKLKSGRETFRKMRNWLILPEDQRIEALRNAGEPIPIYNNNKI